MKTYHLPADAKNAHKIISGQVWAEVKTRAQQGKLTAVTVGDMPKSRAIENKFHAQIADIAAHIGGDLADREDAKRILISAFRIDTRIDLADEWATFGDVRMGRGLRGEVVLLGAQSRHFPAKLAHAFVGWLEAFGAQAGVRFKETHSGT